MCHIQIKRFKKKKEEDALQVFDNADNASYYFGLSIFWQAFQVNPS